MSEYQNNSIFWVETMKIKPNPFQPRKEFEPKALDDLADSIRQYGVLQPLVVTRKEVLRPDNHGMDVHYELIAGERRLRASKIAGLAQVPVIIRKETDDKVKLELAIIENLQREDLNPIDRALAFEQLYKQFNLTHVQIGKKMGKSRVYVSNSLRLLSLPEEIKKGLMAGRITEGHTRPLLMLSDRPHEQNTLYKEIMVKKMSVRDAEKVARSIAQDKVRKKEFKIDPRIRDYEKKLSENLGTRVQIAPKENGGQITIDYFTLNDLEEILTSMKKVDQETNMMDRFIENSPKEFSSSEKQIVQSVNDLASATGVQVDKDFIKNHQDKEQEIQEYHKALPEYSKQENTDIQVHHEELLSKNVSSNSARAQNPVSEISKEQDSNELSINSGDKNFLDQNQDDSHTIFRNTDRVESSSRRLENTDNIHQNGLSNYGDEFSEKESSIVKNDYVQLENFDYQMATPEVQSPQINADSSGYVEIPLQDQSGYSYENNLEAVNNYQNQQYQQPRQSVNFTNQQQSDYQNQQYYQAAPKKKGFFGKLFG